MIIRGFPNIVTSDLAATKDWYVDLFGWTVEFDSDWFVHLKAADAPGVELGLVEASHEIVAEVVTPSPNGAMLTFVVDEVDRLHTEAIERGLDIVEEPRDLFYGQRRMILRDPAGTLIDVSSVCEPSQAFIDSLG